MAPAPAPSSGKAGKVLWGIVILVVFVLIVGAYWFVTRPSGAPKVTAGAKSSTAWFNETSCVTPQQCTYDVMLDSRKVGSVSGVQTPRPDVIRTGPGWVVFQRPVSGIGGYILYGRYNLVTYANASGTVVETGQAPVTLTDVSFTYDLSHMVYVDAHQLAFMDLSTGAVTRSADIPVTADNAQVGIPTFSPDGTKVAVAVGYGPDNERGELYVTSATVPTSFTKIADTPRAVAELVWTPQGAIVWR